MKITVNGKEYKTNIEEITHEGILSLADAVPDEPTVTVKSDIYPNETTVQAGNTVFVSDGMAVSVS